MSRSERAEKLKILTTEGEPEWLKLAKKKAKETMEKMKEKMKEKDGGQNKYLLKQGSTEKTPRKVQQDSSPPTELISEVESKLSGFQGPLAIRVKERVTGLKAKWASLSDDEQTSVSDTMDVLASNLEMFGNAGSNPVGAVMGAINIVGGFATAVGPIGQLVGLGLGFVSSLLGLFGKGEEPKSMDKIVREQIDSALDKFRDESLTDKAAGLVTAFRHSKSYLDGAALSGEPLSELEAILASTRVPMTMGLAFMGELARVIDKLLTDNQVKDAQKCIKYTELYVQLAGLKDLMLTQMISLTPSSLKNDINGVMAHRQNLREATQILLQPLFTLDFSSKILPYFDPDISVITDSFATAVLDLGKYDRSMAGYYCLESHYPNMEFVWSMTIPQLRLRNSGPYTTLFTKRNHKNCYWKLVPHGNHTFSIVNKKGCDRKDARCGWLLSWYEHGSKGYVNIDNEVPMLWEINGNEWKRIRSKWGCDKKNEWCNKELRILPRAYYVRAQFGHRKKQAFRVGVLRPSNGRYYWKLRRVRVLFIYFYGDGNDSKYL
ncbi:hypothetical protein QZH41_010126, partial [Actinostola sp. cb2023]